MKYVYTYKHFNSYLADLCGLVVAHPIFVVQLNRGLSVRAVGGSATRLGAVGNGPTVIHMGSHPYGSKKTQEKTLLFPTRGIF